MRTVICDFLLLENLPFASLSGLTRNLVEDFGI